MLIVETIAKIRRAFFVQGKPIKAICRELRVSRKVVRKVIRSEATEFRYEREAQPLPKVGPWSDQLNELLLANEGKSPRERLTLIRLFEERCVRRGGSHCIVGQDELFEGRGEPLLGPQAFLKLQRAGEHHIVAPFSKPCIEGCVGHTDRQPIHVAPLRLDGPWQLADILAHRGQHGSYGVFLLGFQIF
jgi:hypothetical protein